MFAPAMILGLVGGILGAVFTVANLKMARLRRRLMAKIRRPTMEKIVRFIEPPVIMVRN
jgi:chloride channel 7